MRSEISEADLSTILPEEVEEEVRQAAEISMGTEVHSSPAPVHSTIIVSGIHTNIILHVYTCCCILLFCACAVHWYHLRDIGLTTCSKLGVQVAPSFRHVCMPQQ